MRWRPASRSLHEVTEKDDEGSRTGRDDRKDYERCAGRRSKGRVAVQSSEKGGGEAGTKRDDLQREPDGVVPLDGGFVPVVVKCPHLVDVVCETSLWVVGDGGGGHYAERPGSLRGNPRSLASRATVSVK
jgi:hypothetical protein